MRPTVWVVVDLEGRLLEVFSNADAAAEYGAWYDEEHQDATGSEEVPVRDSAEQAKA